MAKIIIPTGRVQPNAPASLRYDRQGVSLKALYKNTPAKYRQNAQSVALENMVYMISTSSRVRLYCRSHTPGFTKKSRYHTWITGKTRLPKTGFTSAAALIKQPAVLVQCTCPHFTYMYEYANMRHKASFIRMSNGEPAYTTNPNNEYGLCVAKGSLITVKRSKTLWQDVPVELVTPGTEVLTLQGWGVVEQAALTCKDAKTLVVTFSGGEKIRLTPEHRIAIATDKTKAYAIKNRELTEQDYQWLQAKDVIPGEHHGIVRMVDAVTFRKVVSVAESIWPSDVYDLHVPGHENFACNRVIVHNCKHLSALAEYAFSRKL